MALSAQQNPASVFPSNLLTATDFRQSPWWVAHTRSRCEKVLAHKLAEAGIGYFLPLFKKLQPGGTKRRFSVIPLFPGYLFFRGGNEERTVAFKSNQTLQVLAVLDRARLLDELSQIQCALQSRVPIYPHTFLEEGRKVRIKSGLLEGLQGIIVGKKGHYRLLLSVTMVSQAIAVDVGAEEVEPA